MGLDLQRLIAGMAGGMCVSFAYKKSDPWDIVGSVVVGSLFGNYATAEDLSGTLAMTKSLTNTTAFAVGVVAMPLCKTWVEHFKGRKNDNPPRV